MLIALKRNAFGARMNNDALIKMPTLLVFHMDNVESGQRCKISAEPLRPARLSASSIKPVHCAAMIQLAVGVMMDPTLDLVHVWRAVTVDPRRRTRAKRRIGTLHTVPVASAMDTANVMTARRVDLAII